MKSVCQSLQANLQDGQLIVSIAAGISCACSHPSPAQPEIPSVRPQLVASARRGLVSWSTCGNTDGASAEYASMKALRSPRAGRPLKALVTTVSRPVLSSSR